MAITQVSTETRRGPATGGRPTGIWAAERIAFKYMNTFLMVPAFKLGLVKYMVSPFSGYFMMLKTTGRKTGLTRYSPLNFAIVDGDIFCLAGFGEATHWLANLRANPHVEVWLPGGTALAGVADEVEEPEMYERCLTQVLKNAGFAVIFEGMNPFTITTEQVLSRVRGRPLVRIHPTGVGSGPHDAGGWGWVIPRLLQALAAAWLFVKVRRKKR